MSKTYFFNLDEVGEACKDDATDKNEEDQEKKFFVAVLGMFFYIFKVPQCLQSLLKTRLSTFD